MKKYSVFISKPAEHDIAVAVDYIDEVLHNPQAADALLDAIEEAFASLTFFPEKFPVVRDTVLASHGIRMLIIKNYLALYTVDKPAEKIQIVRFLYGKRNWQEILKSDL